MARARPGRPPQQDGPAHLSDRIRRELRRVRTFVSGSCVELAGPLVSTVGLRAGCGRRWHAAPEIEAVEDGLSGVRRVDRREKVHAATAARAFEDVDREDALQ